MAFANPVVGQEKLIRNAIESANFVSGSDGWRIERGGSAEFQNLVARGSIESSSLNVQVSSGITESHVVVDSSTGDAEIRFTHPGFANYISPAEIRSRFNPSPSGRPELFITSAGHDDGGASTEPRLTLVSQVGSEDVEWLFSVENQSQADGLIQLDGVTAISSARMRTQSVVSSANESTTSTSFVYSDTNVSQLAISYTAPPSGLMEFSWGAYLSNSGSADDTFLSIAIFTGEFVGGPLGLAASSSRSAHKRGTIEESSWWGAVIAGHTPAERYTVALAHRTSSGGTAQYDSRTLIVKPSM